MILTFLYAHRNAIVIFLLISGAYWYVASLKDEVRKVQQYNADLVSENATIRMSNNQLLKSIEATNKAVTELAKSTAKVDERFKTLDAKVEKQRLALNNRLLASLGPQPTTCESSIDYLVDRKYK